MVYYETIKVKYIKFYRKGKCIKDMDRINNQTNQGGGGGGVGGEEEGVHFKLAYDHKHDKKCQIMYLEQL